MPVTVHPYILLCELWVRHLQCLERFASFLLLAFNLNSVSCALLVNAKSFDTWLFWSGWFGDFCCSYQVFIATTARPARSWLELRFWSLGCGLELVRVLMLDRCASSTYRNCRLFISEPLPDTEGLAWIGINQSKWPIHGSFGHMYSWLNWLITISVWLFRHAPWLVTSHGRGHRFEPCTAHQHLLNVINDLEDALGVFFSFKSSISAVYYFS